jgi:hypothetical protein
MAGTATPMSAARTCGPPLAAAGPGACCYDIPGMKLKGDVHVANGLRLAWINDPDGNIIHLGDFGGD